jgi:isocitrate/isopropylmalate dehydrogenase
VTWIHKTSVLLHAGGLWADVVATVNVEYQHAEALAFTCCNGLKPTTL